MLNFKVFKTNERCLTIINHHEDKVLSFLETLDDNETQSTTLSHNEFYHILDLLQKK